MQHGTKFIPSCRSSAVSNVPSSPQSLISSWSFKYPNSMEWPRLSAGVPHSSTVIKSLCTEPSNQRVRANLDNSLNLQVLQSWRVVPWINLLSTPFHSRFWSMTLNSWEETPHYRSSTSSQQSHCPRLAEWGGIPRAFCRQDEEDDYQS